MCELTSVRVRVDLGCELTWVGYELTWVRLNLGESLTGCELTWVRVRVVDLDTCAN